MKATINRMEAAFRQQATHAVFMTAIAAFLVTALPLLADREEKGQNRILPPHKEAFGTTYSDLAMAWWDWAVNQPPDKNPITDTTGEFCHQGQDEDFGQGKKIFFLAGNFGGAEQTVRHCRIPKGKALFFPVVNQLWIAPEECNTGECRKISNDNIDKTSVLECIIDGVPVEDIYAYRAQSPPGGSPFHIRAGGLLESLAPDFYVPRDYLPGSVADGYWLLVELNDADDHVIEFRAKVGDPDNPEFQLSVKYVLTTRPPPRILPPERTLLGKSYGEWGAKWWQWALSIPADRNPVADPTGEFAGEGQAGPVWFAPGTFGTDVERSFTIPWGKFVFFPIYNWIFGSGIFDCEPTVPGVPCDVDVLRAGAAAQTETAEILQLTIDGLPVPDVRRYRASSPNPFSLTYPENSVVGVPAGTYYPHITDGYWIMLAPLSRGTHEIRYYVKAPDTLFGLIEFTVLHHITVE
jgi:hypothetical protein